MSRGLYAFLLLIAKPLVRLRLLLRARREPEYGERVAERFGEVPDHISEGVIWFHTVSAGETIAAVPIIRGVQAMFPQVPFLVTTMTPTGSLQVTERLGDVVEHCYAPYDFTGAVQRFFTRVQPRILILMETELWPNMIAAARRRSVPVLLINGRLSERSARGYRRVGGLTRRMLTSIDQIACQTAEHRNRFVALGAPAQRVTVTGSVKFDVSLSADVLAARDDLAQRFNMPATASVWIAASTHPGEDEVVIAAFRQLLDSSPVRLILVPRHPVRAFEVEALVQQAGLSAVRQSQTPSPQDRSADVIIGDVMGSLLTLYGLARAAFIGGSLTELGGHNPIEAALWKIPVVCGPYQFNFTEVMDALLEQGAMRTVTGMEDLTRALTEWLSNEEARDLAGSAALEVVEANRGAADRVLELVSSSVGRAVA